MPSKGDVRTVNHSAKSLLGLLNDVLDTAKLEQNALQLEEAPSLCEKWPSM